MNHSYQYYSQLYSIIWPRNISLAATGILVIVNYISVCIYFPSVVVTYHYFWKDYRPFSCCRGGSDDESKSIKDDQPHSQQDDRKLIEMGNSTTTTQQQHNVAPQDEMTKMFKAIVHWFKTWYANNVVLHPKIKWVVFVAFASLTITFFAFAMHIGPDEKQVCSAFRNVIWNVLCITRKSVLLIFDNLIL